jgi:hypothetical protein
MLLTIATGLLSFTAQPLPFQDPSLLTIPLAASVVHLPPPQLNMQDCTWTGDLLTPSEADLPPCEFGRSYYEAELCRTLYGQSAKAAWIVWCADEKRAWRRYSSDVAIANATYNSCILGCDPGDQECLDACASAKATAMAAAVIVRDAARTAADAKLDGAVAVAYAQFIACMSDACNR